MALVSYKLCLLLAFLSSVLLPSSAFSVETRKVLRAINKEGAYYGLIAPSGTMESFFLDTPGIFVPDTHNPYVDLAGRRFNIGTVQNKSVIFVKCGVGMVNAAATTQLLLGHFEIYAVVHFGTSGSTNGSLQVGDVIVPKEFIHTGLWYWLNPNQHSPSNGVATLETAVYNVPEGGSNKLGKIAYGTEELYSGSGSFASFGAPALWFPVSDYYVELASNLQGTTKLLKCYNEDSPCLPKDPQIVTGLKGSTSNAFIDNAAYRNFLYQTFNVSSADMESSAVVMTCLSNRNPRVVVLRGLVSNSAGEEEDNSFAILGLNNVLRVVVDLIKELPSIPQQAKYM